MSHRKKILVGYGVPLTALFAFRWSASQGYTLGGNPQQGLLDLLEILVLPAGVAAFVVHFSVTFCSRAQTACAVACALIGGLIGPLLLHLHIQSIIANSPSHGDGIQMAYISIPVVYFRAVAVSGIIAVIALKMYELLRSNKDAEQKKECR